MTHTRFYFIKSLKPYGFLRSLTAVSIDGVVKMLLQASIFTLGRIGICGVLRCKTLASFTFIGFVMYFCED